MLYTLSLFVTEPIRFIDAYEWRSLTELEKCALGTYWKSVGDAMGISYEPLPSFGRAVSETACTGSTRSRPGVRRTRPGPWCRTRRTETPPTRRRLS